MNKTFITLLVKLIVTFLATLFAFSLLDDNLFITIVVLSIVATILNYLIGDLVILRNFGNVIASIADALMAALLAFIFSLINDDFHVTFFTILVFAVIIGIFEYFFHKYLESVDDAAPTN